MDGQPYNVDDVQEQEAGAGDGEGDDEDVQLLRLQLREVSLSPSSCMSLVTWCNFGDGVSLLLHVSGGGINLGPGGDRQSVGSGVKVPIIQWPSNGHGPLIKVP